MVKVNLDLSNWILPIATALGAFGGFPEAPAFFKTMAKNELFQYLMLFVLVWQGGSGQDVAVAGIVTVAVFIVNKLLAGAITFGPPAAPAPAE